MLSRTFDKDGNGCGEEPLFLRCNLKKRRRMPILCNPERVR
jgi:hypothetical protein